MTKLRENPLLPNPNRDNWPEELRYQLTELLRQHAIQINGMTEGRVQPVHNATTAAPTAGDYTQGDFIRNSEPEELGSASEKYVIFGWVCVAGGTPGTWKEVRTLTGG